MQVRKLVLDQFGFIDFSIRDPVYRLATVEKTERHLSLSRARQKTKGMND